MIDDFDHILKQLLSNLPQHSPKADVWNKISSSLDEDLAMSRLRRILKNGERTPKKDLWPAIEASLLAPLFWRILFKSSWIKFGLPSLAVLTTLLFVTPYINNSEKDNMNKPLQGNSGLSDVFPATMYQNSKFTDHDMIPAANNIAETGYNISGSNNAAVSDQNILNKEYKNTEFLSENNLAENATNNEVENNTNNYTVAAENSSAPVFDIDKRYYSLWPLTAQVTGNKNQKKNICSDMLPEFLPEIPPRKGLGSPGFSVDFSYAPEMSFVKLQNNSDDYMIDIEKRKQAEMPSYSWSAGIEGKIDFRHFFIQTGVNYSRISSLSEYRYQYSGIDTVSWQLDTMFIFIYIDTLGYCQDSIAYSWSPVTSMVTSDYKKSAAMQINYLQVPLVCGYSVSRGKFQYSASGGVSFGIPLSVSGRMIEPDNYTISNVSQQSLPLSKIMYTGLLRLGVNYYMSPHYSVFAQPSARFTLNSVFDKSYPVNQKYWTFGLRLGINYHF